MQRQIVDVSALIQTQRVGRFAWSLLGWMFVCMLLDGFDFAGISFVVVRTPRAGRWRWPRSARLPGR
jgi:hypothetical protein